MCLLEQTTLALQESHGAVAVILDGLDLDLSPTHDKLRAQDMRADVGSMGSG